MDHIKSSSRNSKVFFGWLVLGFVSFIFIPASANPGPAGLGIQGVLADTNGQPILSTVTFRLQVLDSSETCVLFEEYHTNQNLAASTGVFSLNLGSGSGRVNKIDSSTTLKSNIFRNDVTPLTVTDCTNPLVMSSGLNRKVRITFDAGSGPVTLSPNVTIQSSAYASVAETLQGKAPSDLAILKDDATTDLTQANLESVFSATNFPALMGLIAGTSTSYERAGRLNGGTIPTVGIGESLRWNGTGWDTFVAGGGTIGVASVTAGSGLLGGTITSNGTLSVNTGTSAGQIVQLDGTAKIPTALLPSLSTAMITSGTLGVANGGTGRGTVSPYSILIGNMTGTAYDATTCSTQGMYLEWQASTGFVCVPFSASSVTTGTLGTAFGGLGLNATTAGTGQLLIGNGNNTGFTLAQLTAGTGIQITNGAGSIAISLNGLGAAGPTGPTGDSVWAISGSTINYMAGSVGVGTANPTSAVDIASGNSLVLGAATGGSDRGGRIRFRRPFDGVGNGEIGYILSGTSSVLGINELTGNGEIRMRAVGDSGGFFSVWTNPGGAGAAEAMRVASSGFVGIGTTSPTQLLDVNGAIRVRPSTLPSSPTSGVIAIDSAASNSLKYFNGTVWNTLGVTGGAGGGGTSTSAMTFNSNTDNSASDGGFNFQSNGSNLLTISNAGDVNITSTTPSTSNTTGALTVTGGLGVAGMVNALKLAASSTSTSVYAPTGATSVPNGVNGAVIQVKNNSLTDGVGAYQSYQVFNTTGNLQNAYIGAISTTGASYTPSIIIGQQTAANSYAERMRIDSNGNVGIGTTNPLQALSVTGSISATSAMIATRFESTSGNIAWSPLATSNTTAGTDEKRWDLYQDATTLQIRAMNDAFTAGNTGLRLGRTGSTVDYVSFPNGNVGIGTTAPVATLHFAGSRSAPAWTTSGIGIRQDAATYTDTSSSGTVSNTAINALSQPTMAASSATTYTRASTLYIPSAPANGANVTISNSYGLDVNAAVRLGGKVVIGGGQSLSSATSLLNITAGGGLLSAPSWTTTGIMSATLPAIVTDTSGSGTIATRTANSFASPTYASTNPVTLTNASTVYIESAPAAGTNTTITNPLALHVAAGNSSFGGNVGIGTSSFSSRLAVDNPTGPMTISNVGPVVISDFVTNTGDANVGGAISFSGHDGANGRLLTTIQGLKENSVVGNYDSYLRFGTRTNGNAVTEKMRITSGGNVGIGTTSPTGMLHVNGQIMSTGTATSNAPNAIRLDGYNNGGRISALGPNASTKGNFQIEQYSSDGSIGSIAMTIAPTGNVGIGTTAPDERLDLGGGNIKMGWERISNTCTSAVTCTATCTAGKRATGGSCSFSGSWVHHHTNAGDSSYVCNTSGTVDITVSVYCANIR